MDNIRNSIEILFSKYNPEKIIQVFFQGIDAVDMSEDILIEPFLAISETLGNGKTKDEWEAVYRIVNEEWNLYSTDKSRSNQEQRKNVFYVLYNFAKDVLIEQEEKPVCEFSQLLRWRDLSYKLGEDIFTTVFFAYEDLPRKRERHYFSWLPIVPTNNCHLQEILERGITDIHFHLYGSSLNFDISWLSLMNRITGRKREFEVIKISKKPDALLWFGEPNLSLYALYIKAFAIRQMLFRIIIKDTLQQEEVFKTWRGTVEAADNNKTIVVILSTKTYKGSTNLTLDDWKKLLIGKCVFWANDNDSVNDIITDVIKASDIRDETITIKFSHSTDKKAATNDLIFIGHKIRRNIIDDLYLPVLRCKTEEELIFYTYDLQKEAEILSHLYGKKYGNDYVDYAIKKTFSDKNYDADSYHNSVLYGERWLMYKMFSLIFSAKKERTVYKAFFYAYLIIKIKIGNELIQVNPYPGFRNFQEYQDRKSIFIPDNSVYEELLVNVAINNALQCLHVKYLEARVPPNNTLKEIECLIKKLDKTVHSPKFARDIIEAPYKKPLNHNLIYDEYFDKKYIDNKDRFFYIFHFIKKKDKISQYNEIELVNPRHFELRQSIKEQTMAINLLRRQGYPLQKPPIKERLVGIDAANSEIGCRPEVFAQAYRYLRGYSTELDNHFLTSSTIMRLGYTYHVGEDFLDISDGLRAIDETVKFLNFNRSDRLGHGLALGVNPNEYYEKKKYQVILPKQDFLDNVIWLMMQVRIFNLTTKQSLLFELQNHYTTLIHHIYKGEVINEQKKKHNGDKMIDVCGIPIEIYYLSWLLRGDEPFLYFNDTYGHFNPVTYWEKCGENYLPECNKARENSTARSLYQAYHFSAEAKLRGNEPDEFKISRDYVNLIMDIQNAMMRDLARKHIAIETNPTSNKLIGDYKLYADLPLKRFFNLGLTYDSQELSANPQLSVSLNTDDLGVFSTSIENEYALMAIALEKETNQDGQPRYTSRMIYGNYSPPRYFY